MTVKPSQLVAVVDVYFDLRRDGMLYIHSPDMPGLHLCSNDVVAVMKDVVPAIAALFKLNQGVDVQITPSVGVDALVKGIHTATVTQVDRVPARERYVLAMAA